MCYKVGRRLVPTRVVADLGEDAGCQEGIVTAVLSLENRFLNRPITLSAHIRVLQPGGGGGGLVGRLRRPAATDHTARLGRPASLPHQIHRSLTHALSQ